jgi:hypothetical protein
MSKRKKPQPQEFSKEVYAEMRRKFSAADLAKYAKIEKGIPVEQVIAEMERINRELEKKERRRGV